jgi:hypothetical protein
MFPVNLSCQAQQAPGDETATQTLDYAAPVDEEIEERITLLLDCASYAVLDFDPKRCDQNFEAFGIDAKIP